MPVVWAGMKSLRRHHFQGPSSRAHLPFHVLRKHASNMARTWPFLSAFLKSLHLVQQAVGPAVNIHSLSLALDGETQWPILYSDV